MHVCVIDNASQDGTQEQIQNYLQSPKPDLVLEPILNSKNVGFTKSVNQGLALARNSHAEYILFLNPDIVLPGDALLSLVPLFEARSVDVIAPQLAYEDGSVQPSCRRFPHHRDVLFNVAGLAALFPESAFWNGWKMGDFDHKSSREVDQPQGAFLLARAQVAFEIGKWDEAFPMFFSDVDWCLRVKQAGYRTWFAAETQVLHHQGRSVHAARPQMILSSHRSFIRYFYRHFRGWQWIAPNALTAVLLVFSGAARYIAAQIFSMMRKLK